MTENFEATHQKVGTFQIVDGAKVGGNVASYFCLSDGTVVHAVAGPLDAKHFLQEAKWALEVRKLAISEAHGDASTYRATLRKAHLERLSTEFRLRLPPNALPQLVVNGPPEPATTQILMPAAQRLGNQAKVHILLAAYPLPRLSQLYPIVFEDILKEKLSSLPVQSR